MCWLRLCYVYVIVFGYVFGLGGDLLLGGGGFFVLWWWCGGL